MSACMPNVERASTQDRAGGSELFNLPPLVLFLQHADSAHGSNVVPRVSKSIKCLESIRNWRQQGVVGQLVKSHEREGLLNTCWKVEQWLQVAILRFVVLIKRECRHLQLHGCASVLHQADVVRANLPVSRSLLPCRNKAGSEYCSCRKEGLCPSSPYLRLEARSFEDPGAVGRVGHDGPFELRASCPAAGGQASARAES